MLWIGSKLFTAASQPDFIPDLDSIIRESSPRQTKLIEWTQDIPYNSEEVKIFFAEKSEDDQLLHFLVNTEAGRGLLGKSQYREWAWEKLSGRAMGEILQPPEDLVGKQITAPLLATELRLGWLLFTEHGRVDADTTWSRNHYLWETQTIFAYAHHFAELLH